MTEKQSSAGAEAAAPKTRGAALWGAVGILIAIAAISVWRFQANQADRAALAAFIPTCTSPDARSGVKNAIEGNPAQTNRTFRLLDIRNVQELKASKSERLCAGTLILNSGRQETRYIVSHASDGNVLVEVGADLDIEVAQVVAATGPGPVIGFETQAFRLIYQGDAPAKREVDGDAYSYNPTDVEGANGLIPVGDKLAYVTDGKEEDAGHTANGLVSVHYFQKTGDKLALVGSWANIDDAGSSGTIAGAKLRRDLLPNPVLVIEGGGMWQGCLVGFSDLVELTPQAPVMRASVLTDFDNGQDGAEHEAVQGTLHQTAQGFSVTYTGGTARTVEYVRKGDKFVPTTSIDDLPGC